MADKFVIDTNVIDTNVAISANGINTHASLACQLACIMLLETCKKLHIAIDEAALIMAEYARHPSHAGQPGVGDLFFKYLHDHQHVPDNNIHRVKITPSDDAARGFNELPINTLDLSDRKFLATAVVANATIVNATDSDWEARRELLGSLAITPRQVRPEHSCK